MVGLASWLVDDDLGLDQVYEKNKVHVNAILFNDNISSPAFNFVYY